MIVQRTRSLNPSSLGMLGLLLVAGSGCGEDPLPTGTNNFPSNPGGGSGDGDWAPGDGDSNPGGDGDWNNPNPGGGGHTGALSKLPCDLQQVVQTKCVSCHADMPLFGATMSLTSYEAFTDPSSDPSVPVYQAVKDRIHRMGTGRMPPSPGELTEAELAAFDAWIDAGAPENTTSCSGGGDGDVIGPGRDPCADGECELDTTGLECYKFTAHNGDKKAKFKLGEARDKYFNFHFKAPWTGTAYGMIMRPIIDNKSVIHHWLLFQQNGGVGFKGDGVKAPSDGTHPDGDLVHGWAPGGGVANFRNEDVPGGVGLEFKEGDAFIVEYHYNSTDANAQDASGVEVCVQKEKPAQLAGVSWLGTDALVPNSSRGQGTCKPTSNQPIHILSVSPHMHVKGKHMKAVINRKGGTKDVLHDAPFEFENQTWYSRKATLAAGDTITVRCDFSSAITRFGTATSDEMCYLFTVAYPKNALANNDPIGQAFHGAGSCLGDGAEGAACGLFGSCIE